MAEISRAALFGKLTPLAYGAIESATAFCRLRGNPVVELPHWLHQLLNAADSDLHRILRHFDIDASALSTDLLRALDRLPRGASSVTDLSSWVEAAVERGWVWGSLLFGDSRVRSGYLVVGLLKTANLRHLMLAMSRQFERIKVDELAERFAALTAGSPEDAPAVARGPVAPGDAAGASQRCDALARYTASLTDAARAGRCDPIVGRDDEIRQVVDILMRRRQNNPILVGEAGVGKTAVVEGFAQRIVRGDVPPALKDVDLRSLDLGLLQAGAGAKGEFEQRLRAVIDEVQASVRPVVLFIDETHLLVGAGGPAGTGDAANLLKPALARGELRTIGATTWAEYRRYIEKDPALTRRFQSVQVDEPDEAKAVAMLRGVAARMEAHHGVQVLDEALQAAVQLSHRYIPARQLPDKAVSLLDTACARVAVSLHAVPAEVDDARQRIELLRTERAIVAREASIGIEVDGREQEIEKRLEDERGRLQALEQRWHAERECVDRLLDLRTRLRQQDADAADATARDAARAELRGVQAALSAQQGERPLVVATVDRQAVAEVVAGWTGIPVGRMARDEIDTVLRLPEILSRRVIGQDHAMETIARRIRTSRAGIDDPGKPVGVFLLAGTSGVGKTETALALAEALYGGEQNLITINMSEYQEAHTVSSLKGAPPGYVGYGEGGVLTEAVRRRPYSVVLLDEVEKAHADVHELFFQVFDKGWMEDGEGRRIDFRNTVILLTTNVGTDEIAALCPGRSTRVEIERLRSAIEPPLLRVFPPALLGRLVVVPYHPLTDDVLARIVRLQFDRIVRRMREGPKVELRYDDAAVGYVLSRCTASGSGGRMIDALLTQTLLADIGRDLLAGMAAQRPAERVDVSASERGLQYRWTAPGPAVDDRSWAGGAAPVEHRIASTA